MKNKINLMTGVSVIIFTLIFVMFGVVNAQDATPPNPNPDPEQSEAPQVEESEDEKTPEEEVGDDEEGDGEVGDEETKKEDKEKSEKPDPKEEEGDGEVLGDEDNSEPEPQIQLLRQELPERVDYCHFPQEDEDGEAKIFEDMPITSWNKENGHVKHDGDFIINEEDDNPDNDRDDCVAIADPDPIPPVPTQCNLTIESDTDDYVVEKTAFAKLVSDIHDRWDAIIPDANWIWGDDPVADPVNKTIQTFVRKFDWNGSSPIPTLEIASDNSYVVELNGVVIGSDPDEDNHTTADTIIGFEDHINNGENTLEITVKNWAQSGGTTESNPAGLLYKLSIDGEVYEGETCGEEIPYVEDNDGDNDNGDDEIPPILENSCLIPSTEGDTDDDDLTNIGEKDLQEILDDRYVGIDKNDDQLQIQNWTCGADKLLLDVEFVGQWSDHGKVFGYYTDSDLNNFIPIFRNGNVSGDDSGVTVGSVGDEFTIDAGEVTNIGFAMKSWTGSAYNTYATDNSLNPGDVDKVVAYNPESDTYMLGFDDLLNNHIDFNDLVVEVKARCEEASLIVENSCLIPSLDEDEDNDDLSFIGEKDLQEILDDRYTDIDKNDDQLQIQNWTCGADKLLLDVEFLGRWANDGKVFGYYTDSSLNDFTPIFRNGNVSGDDSGVTVGSMGDEFTIDAGQVSNIGFAIKTWRGGSYKTYATDSSLSNAGADKVVAYNPEPDTYMLAFDDLLNTHVDFNDLVVEIKARCESVDDTEYPYGEITYPVNDGDVVAGTTTLMAEYYDGDDDNDDAVQWAVKSGSCSVESSNVLGNVGGLSDVANWDGQDFSFEFNADDLVPGDYCFVFNPTDDGPVDVRETRLFTVEDDEEPNSDLPKVTQFFLVDADTDLDLFEITEGLVININNTPLDSVNIRAVTEGTLESVIFELNSDPDVTENISPYALFGDNSPTDYKAGSIALGSYTLTATPYTQDNGGGDVGTALTVNFEVVDEDNTPPVITLIGDSIIEITVGGSYNELGATTTDAEDDPNPPVVIGGDTVDVNTEGTYVVTYNSTDSDGAPATQVTRTVNVIAAPTVTTNTNSGRSSGRSGSRSRSFNTGGEVLGATTDNTCDVYLNDYMRQDLQNDPFEVIKLQVFLMTRGFEVPVNGVFGSETDQAVRDFQSNLDQQILVPWLQYGFGDGFTPTGYVYKTTKYTINNIVCPGSEDYPDLP